MATLDTKVVIPEGIVFAELDGEAVLLNEVTGKYFGLDQVGLSMWKALGRHGALSRTVTALLEEFNVGEEQIRRDLTVFVDRLVAHELLRIDDE
jgi:hypothetical protein